LLFIQYGSFLVPIAKLELELSTANIRDASQAIQKISAVLNSISSQGSEVKELEVDSEKEE
jgi:hypothetical protein